MDIDTRRDELPCARALTQLGEFAKWVRVLGTYKGWETSQAEADLEVGSAKWKVESGK